MQKLDIRWIAAEHEAGFGAFSDEDEYLHGTGPQGDSLTETWYWGFNIPHANINCFAYCWVHPNLKVVSSGLMIYRGIKLRHVAAELFDYQTYLSMKVVGNGREIEVPGGMRITVVDPLRDIRMTYNATAQQIALDIRLIAVTEPIMRANSKHFEQIMHTKGELLLRGERHEVDSYNVRDRSWGELRPEAGVPVPPYNWVTGVFNEGQLAFTIGAMDTIGQEPRLERGVWISESAAFTDAWVRRDEQNFRIARVHRRTEREMKTLRPIRHLIEFEDTEGKRHTVKGEVVASMPHSAWHNMQCHIALVRWEVNGSIGWGESQDCQWNDFVWRYSGH